MKEIRFTKNVCNDLRHHGAFVFAIVGGGMQTPGLPDRYVHHHLWCGFLEFKGDDTILRPLQVHTLKSLNEKRPGTAYVIRAPNRIESPTGDLLDTFVNALDLLKKCAEKRE